MNNLQPSQNDLQMQIGEYLANMMHQIDNKLGSMIQALAAMENNVNQIHTRLNQLETAIYNPNKRLTKNGTFHQDMDNDSELKRKVSQARQEQELNLLLEKEKIKWEREQLDRELIIEQAKIEWENEKIMQTDKKTTQMFSYLS